ncbi:hypothetical protein TYRP_018248 [Tyrophagus putrescentiae]|nr:hypothetical protein TYRP_018248 [Tyrophagus putrescentiae]
MNSTEKVFRLTAQRKFFRNLPLQRQYLTWCFEVLHETTAATAKSRAFILQKLKNALRTQYKDCFPLPQGNRCTVLLLFDNNKNAFFEIRVKPKDWPESWPTRLDYGSSGNEIELLSNAIYSKVLQAFGKENGMGVEEPPQTLGIENSSSGGDGGGDLLSSDVEGTRLRRVIVQSKTEVIVIGSDEEDEEEAVNNVQNNEEINRRASVDGNVNNSDQRHEELEETEEEAMDYNNTPPKVNSARQPREVSGSSNNNSSSNCLSFLNTSKQAPIANSIQFISRKRPLESTSNSESLQNPPPLSPLSAAPKSNINFSTTSQSDQLAIAERFLVSPTFHKINNPKERLNCPLCKRSLEKRLMVDHLNILHFRKPPLYRCNWPKCGFTSLWQFQAENHVITVHKDNLEQHVVLSATPGAVGQQQQSAHPATMAASTSVSTSSSTSFSNCALTETFFNSAEYAAARSSSYVACPLCPGKYTKSYIIDHIYGKHHSLKLYRCTWPGCITGNIKFSFFTKIQNHVKTVHNQKKTRQYIWRDPVGASAAVAFFDSISSSSSLSAAVAAANQPRPLAKISASNGSHSPVAYTHTNNALSLFQKMTITADGFYASSVYAFASIRDFLSCPFCAKIFIKEEMQDHINTVHMRRHRYCCAWPGEGCKRKSFGYRANGERHLQKVHQSKEYDRYLRCRF